MNNYFTYLLIASLTIASPDPGIILSISNSLKYGFVGALPGIIGVSIGMFIVASISATSIGAILTSSPTAFAVARIIGAMYLGYLGIKLLNSKNINLKSDLHESEFILPSFKLRFKEGFILTLSNPKPIIFFVALFPQFMNITKSYIAQFLTLSTTFCALVILIHSAYAMFSHFIKNKIISNGKFILINQTAGICFLGFAGVIFATTRFG